MPPDPNKKPKVQNPSVGGKRSGKVSSSSPASDDRLHAEFRQVDFAPAWDPAEDKPDYAELIITDFSFALTVEQTDMAGKTPLFQKFQHDTDTSAHFPHPKPEQLILHANNRVRFTGTAGVDESPTRRIHRTWRNWTLDLDAANRDQAAPGAEYEIQASRRAFELDGVAEPFQGGWADVPGHRLTNRSGANVNQRIVREFMVGLYKHPEFGAYTYLVLIDQTPTRYRVRHSDPVQLTKDEWIDRTRDETTIAQLEKDTTPQPDPATITNWAFDTQWIAYPGPLAQLPP